MWSSFWSNPWNRENRSACICINGLKSCISLFFVWTPCNENANAECTKNGLLTKNRPSASDQQCSLMNQPGGAWHIHHLGSNIGQDNFKAAQDFSDEKKGANLLYPYANHGAGIFTYIYPTISPVLYVNIPYMEHLGYNLSQTFLPGRPTSYNQ